MFWNAKAQISRQMYESFRPVANILRLFGVFPLAVHEEGSRLFLRWSPLYAAYSFVVGAVVIVIAYYIVLYGVFINNGTLRAKSITDKIVYTFGLNSYAVVIFWGIFVVPCKFLQFFDYIKCVYKVDLVIHTAHTKCDKFKSLLIVFSLIVLETICTKLEIYLIYQAIGKEMGLLGILKDYIGFDLSVLVSLIVEYTSWYVAHTVEKRLRRMKEALREISVQIKEQKILKRVPGYSQLAAMGFHTDSIITFRKVYLEVLDAVELLKQIVNLGILIQIVSIYFQIIESSYLFIVPLTRSSKRAIEMVPKALLFFMQIIRALLITEPWYACMVQVESIKGQVCHLLSLNSNQRYRREVRRFAVILGLRQFQFTACDLFTVDRLLFTELIGSITTLLVILLQYSEEVGH